MSLTPSARAHWQALAENYDLAALRNIGHLYRRGLGVEKDLEITSSAFDEGTVYVSGVEEERTTYNTGIAEIDIEELGLTPVKHGQVDENA